MADVRPFRAVRYSGAAGALADLVAPPYDIVDDEDRARLYDRSPYNVLHVTLPESAEDAGRLYRAWLDEGILERDDDDVVWVSVERYVGPDGVARERRGAIVSLAAEPYARGTVLPHERTQPAVRAERLGLLRATRVQPEPILVLADGTVGIEVPATAPDLEVDGTSLWRVPGEMVSDLALGQLLIADGHHRYESTLDFGDELGTEARIMALVVETTDPGLDIFPTHRVFAGRPDLASLQEGVSYDDLDSASSALESEPTDRAAAVAYRPGGVELVRGAAGQLDAELVDSHGLEGIRYTPRADEAVQAVERGEADVAYLMRRPRVDDVFALARRGERMPPKSTYFFPKPLSGLVFHPLAA